MDTSAGDRGDVQLVKEALLLEEASVDSSRLTSKRMVFVCGCDGFVDYWAGGIVRDENKKKIQGPLRGLLSDAGLTSDEVYKF